jgi:hypothetical protein
VFIVRSLSFLSLFMVCSLSPREKPKRQHAGMSKAHIRPHSSCGVPRCTRSDGWMETRKLTKRLLTHLQKALGLISLCGRCNAIQQHGDQLRRLNTL